MLVERYHKDTDLPSAEWKEIGPKGSDGSEPRNAPFTTTRLSSVQPSRTKGGLVARDQTHQQFRLTPGKREWQSHGARSKHPDYDGARRCASVCADGADPPRERRVVFVAGRLCGDGATRALEATGGGEGRLPINNDEVARRSGSFERRGNQFCYRGFPRLHFATTTCYCCVHSSCGDVACC